MLCFYCIENIQRVYKSLGFKYWNILSYLCNYLLILKTFKLLEVKFDIIINNSSLFIFNFAIKFWSRNNSVDVYSSEYFIKMIWNVITISFGLKLTFLNVYQLLSTNRDSIIKYYSVDDSAMRHHSDSFGASRLMLEPKIVNWQY